MARSSDVEYKMRMTQDLKDKIVESAKVHNRSMNADIVARLEQTFKPSEEIINAISFNKVISLFADYLSEEGLTFVVIKKDDISNFESGRHLLLESSEKKSLLKEKKLKNKESKFMNLENEYLSFIDSDEINSEQIDAKSNVDNFLRRLALSNFISSNSALIDQNWWKDRKVRTHKQDGSKTYEFTPQDEKAKFSNKAEFLEWVAYNIAEANKAVNS